MQILSCIFSTCLKYTLFISAVALEVAAGMIMNMVVGVVVTGVMEEEEEEEEAMEVLEELAVPILLDIHALAPGHFHHVSTDTFVYKFQEVNQEAMRL